MITQYGYDTLLKRYSTPISNPTPLQLFIQEMYIHYLKEQYSMSQSTERYISHLPNGPTKNLARLTSICPPIPVGPCLVGCNIPHRPFYEDCLKIAKFVSKYKSVKFHKYPYVPTPYGMVENKSNIIMKVYDRGELPELNKEELDWAKKEIAAIIKHSKINVVHNIIGSGGYNSWTNQHECKILFSTCAVPKKHLTFISKQWM